ncbi:helix-turn-helix domain-containing protein [Nocardioides lijunqiniae]|uniref:helix-turn-helix domain-containing protein n=1 Tax=Nocardioides lijunqiniae TaxID=2760832 RepID=UPI001877809C
MTDTDVTEVDVSEVDGTDLGEIEVPATTEVRRRVPLAAALGVAGAVLAIAYLVRAVDSGSALDWSLFAFMTVLGGVYLAALVDARAPLLVADGHGLRIRRGRSWHGLPWTEVERVEHLAPRGPLRDGRLDVIGADGTEWGVRLGLASRVTGAGDDLATTLLAHSGYTADVVEIDLVPADELVADEPDDESGDRPDDEPDRPTEAEGDVEVRDPAVVTHAPDAAVEAPEDRREAPEAPAAPAAPAAPVAFASPTPNPLRALVRAARSESRRHQEPGAEPAPVPVENVRPLTGDDTQSWSMDALPADEDGTVVIGDLSDVPLAVDPVVGPELASARARLGLSIDQLADRTRIRPHVIEAIEVDDFAPCGGDFYARGHLRTLARVLGVDVAPLLAAYDERYADAPVDPRRVFESELATGFGGSIRGTRGGPNWSVLVAAVMAVVLVWAVARLVTEGTGAEEARPRLNASGGLANGTTANAAKVPVVLTATGGGATVVVRDAGGNVVYDGAIAFMQSVTLKVAPPVRVQSSDGSVTVSVDGDDRGEMGKTGQESSATYVVR